MNMPNQSAPVQRSIPTASISQGNGVQASDTLDDILTITQAALPLVASLGSFL